MRANNYRKSLNFSKQNHLKNQLWDPNASVQLSSSFGLGDFNQSQSMTLPGSYSLNESSLILSGTNDCDLKSAKKKMGIQLSILEKNILCESKENGEKSRRLNRSGFVKNKQNESRASLFDKKNNTTVSTSLNQLLKSKKSAMEQSKVQNITSADLQQIRRLDKDIYKLYIDLYHDEREELEKIRQKDAVIQQLKLEIKEQQQKELLLSQEMERIKLQQAQVEQQTHQAQIEWVKSIRQKLLQNL